MTKYNCILIFNKEQDHILFGREVDESGRIMYRMLGGEVEVGMMGMIAAYCSMARDTGFTGQQVQLTQVMDLPYPEQDFFMEVYVGEMTDFADDEPDGFQTEWISIGDDFFDPERFLGADSVGQIVAEVLEEMDLDPDSVAEQPSAEISESVKDGEAFAGAGAAADQEKICPEVKSAPSNPDAERKIYNCVVMFDPEKTHVLFCRRTKDPYRGLYNFVGGKVEPDEDHGSAALRELREETGITGVQLYHFMDLTYYYQNMLLEMYVGQVKEDVELIPEVNPLEWLPLTEDFTDPERFAGEQNIAHIINVALKYPFLRTKD